MPTHIVVNNLNQAMRVNVNEVIFINDARLANKYPSKYAAKRHLKQLDNIPEDVRIVELLTVEG